MEILELQLCNFRNFSAQKIIFDKELTVIIGPNGSGKSNVLEAVSLLCGIKPIRIETDLDLVKFAKSEARIESKVVSQSEKKALTINFQVIDESIIKKSFLIDGFKKRFSDFMVFGSIVVFHPEDLDLVIGSPSVRRHHLDSLLSACDRDYWRNTSSYNKIVVRRNKVLQRIAEGKSKIGELSFWDERLLEHAKYIFKKREEYFEFLNFINVPKDLSWQYRASELSEEKLIRNRERDIAAQMTLSGPHRDDYRFKGKNRDLAFFGSRGEQRMAVLYFKLAQLDYLGKKRGNRPILALDDIFSELDWEHREAVLSVISNQQTIITAAERESVPKNLLKKAKVLEL